MSSLSERRSSSLNSTSPNSSSSSSRADISTTGLVPKERAAECHHHPSKRQESRMANYFRAGFLRVLRRTRRWCVGTFPSSHIASAADAAGAMSLAPVCAAFAKHTRSAHPPFPGVTGAGRQLFRTQLQKKAWYSRVLQFCNIACWLHLTSPAVLAAIYCVVGRLNAALRCCCCLLRAAAGAGCCWRLPGGNEQQRVTA